MQWRTISGSTAPLRAEYAERSLRFVLLILWELAPAPIVFCNGDKFIETTLQRMPLLIMNSHLFHLIALQIHSSISIEPINWNCVLFYINHYTVLKSRQLVLIINFTWNAWGLLSFEAPSVFFIMKALKPKKREYLVENWIYTSLLDNLNNK
jgi:hypothetical protein